MHFMTNRMTLFCFPYAGGSAAMFNSWRRLLDRRVDLQPVEYAGRGKRIGEPLYPTMAHAVDDIYQIMRHKINGGAYALFGHSLGAMLAYELVNTIRHDGMPAPQHVFFSGRSAPCCPERDAKLRHCLPDDEFKQELLELGGTASELFDHPELLELIMPVVRNDFRLAEEYEYQGNKNLLDCDITILLGKDENVLPEEAEAWRLHSKKNCFIRYFEGGHFFIQDQLKSVMQLVNTTLGFGSGI